MLLRSRIKSGASIEYSLEPNRRVWLQVTDGSLSLNGIGLEPRDGAAIKAETALTLEAKAGSDVYCLILHDEEGNHEKFSQYR